jgi:hypothetical protein
MLLAGWRKHVAWHEIDEPEEDARTGCATSRRFARPATPLAEAAYRQRGAGCSSMLVVVARPLGIGSTATV